MFEKRNISIQSTIDFWESLSSEQSEIRLNNQVFLFSKKKDEIVINIKNEKVILNPKIDFIQARIDKKIKGQTKIIVETKKIISLLYQGLIIFASVFIVLNIINKILPLIFLTIVLGLIMRYNYNQINKAIIDFEEVLKKNSQIK